MSWTPREYLNEAVACLESSNYAAAQAYSLVGLLSFAIGAAEGLLIAAKDEGFRDPREG